MIPRASSTFIILSREGWLAGSFVRWDSRMLLLLRWRGRVVVVASSVFSSTFFDFHVFRQGILDFRGFKKSLYIYSQLHMIDL